MKKKDLVLVYEENQNKTKISVNSKRKQNQETFSCSVAKILQIKNIIRKKAIYWELRKISLVS